MRSSKMNGYIGKFDSSFLSVDKDTESIIRKLFVESKPHSEELKRLLVINTEDCLRDRTNPKYLEKLKSMTVENLIKEKYVRIVPRIEREENQEEQTYIIISFDNFTPNESNSYYRDCTVMIDILCHPDHWNLGNYQLRPIKIAGYIDGILNGARFSGIGTFKFMGCNELILQNDLCGYCLIYSTTHGVDDAIPADADE